MEILFLGSGGSMRIPRACCKCTICEEARAKGIPYKRLGQSLFIKTINALFDTPEDINTELNLHHIDKVENLFFSHWHPDHTAGLRIMEVLKFQKSEPLINLYISKMVREDIIRNIHYFSHFEKKFCKTFIVNQIQIENIKITFLKLNQFMNAFIIEENNKKILYCPCHSKDLLNIEFIEQVDLLIMNCGDFSKHENSKTTFDHNLKVIEYLKPQKTILTHIEEYYHKDYNQLCHLELKYKNLYFAYDGMSFSI